MEKQNEVLITRTCPSCKKRESHTFTVQEWENYSHGMLIQEAMPKRTAFEREFLISNMCFECQSKIFNRPMPGDDWGKSRECPVCGCNVWDKDNGVCPSCHSKLDEEET